MKLSNLENLGTLDQRPRMACAKGQPAVLARRERRAKKQSAEDKARDQVWARDQAISRASGKPVLRGHVDERRRGEVAHIGARSTNPAKRYAVSNQVLLTAEEHRLSDPRTAGASGKRLLEIVGKDADKMLTFIWYSLDGRELRRSYSEPL